MRTFTPRDLIDALRAVGLMPDDTVYVHSRLFSLGKLAGASSQDEFCAGIYAAFREVVGEQGTIVVPTFTMTIGRFSRPFVLEKTPAETGIFSEYIRRLPGACRSLHPINSVVAIGRAASDITANVSRSNYGLDTPFDRMLRLKAKAVNLGFSDRFSNSFHHHLETCLGLPYLYNKLLDMEVFAGGVRVRGPFFASLRYLDFGIEYNLKPFDQLLFDQGVLRKVRVGASVVSCIPASIYMEQGLKALSTNPYFFLARPPQFRHGERPWDGAPIAQKPLAEIVSTATEL